MDIIPNYDVFHAYKSLGKSFTEDCFRRKYRSFTGKEMSQEFLESYLKSFKCHRRRNRNVWRKYTHKTAGLICVFKFYNENGPVYFIKKTRDLEECFNKFLIPPTLAYCIQVDNSREFYALILQVLGDSPIKKGLYTESLENIISVIESIMTVCPVSKN